MNREENKKQFIERAKLIYGDKYDYSKVNYVNAHTNVEIICKKKHGSFFQSPHNHLKKECKLCATENAQQIRSKGIDKFIDDARKVHGDKYDYSEVIYINKSTKIKIKCLKCNKVFEQTPEVHLRGSNCTNYTNCPKELKNTSSNKITKNPKKNIDNTKSKTEQFIEEAKIIHGDKYDYSETEYINSHTKVKIKCLKCNKVFEQTPSNHFHNDCPKCAKENADAKYRFTTEQFIQKAIAIHGNKYDYLKVNYINYGTHVEIICPKLDHGSFFQTPSNHLSHKHKCIKCRDDLNGDNKRDTFEEFIEKANKIHNNKYNYSKVIYVNANTKVEIICGDHSFFQTPKSHLQKTNCPKCVKKSFSMKAITWLEYVAKKDNITIQHAMNTGEYKLLDTNLKVDGFCVETKTVFEFFGDFFHGNPKYYNPLKINPVNKQTFGDLYIKTLERIVLIQGMEYNLVAIWEHEWDQISKNLLTNKIN